MAYRADAPENTRLFILCGKGVKEDLLREKFEQYGKIDDLWVVKDKRTNEDKGKYWAIGLGKKRKTVST